MIQYNIFPQANRRIVTFSYDDGKNDAALIELFNKYNVKATFHLNGENLDDQTIAEMRELYKGHEISCHTANHGYPTGMAPITITTETLNNRKLLEKIAQYPVVGMSYPCGAYNSATIEAMRSCGIVYSRTIKNTMSFLLPLDFMEWHPSCHHKDALSICDIFLRNLDSRWFAPLFYIWGHAVEFQTEEQWNVMIQILEKLSNNEKIWYATNMEIYRYVTAQRNLVISADETMFYNPSDIDVWVEKDKTQVIMIPAGETVRI